MYYSMLAASLASVDATSTTLLGVTMVFKHYQTCAQAPVVEKHRPKLSRNRFLRGKVKLSIYLLSDLLDQMNAKLKNSLFILMPY